MLLWKQALLNSPAGNIATQFFSLKYEEHPHQQPLHNSKDEPNDGVKIQPLSNFPRLRLISLIWKHTLILPIEQNR